MRIGMAFHPINNLGGLINWAEDMSHAFKRLGHTVVPLLLRWSDRAVATTGGNWAHLPLGHMGMRVCQDRGWQWPARAVIPYRRSLAAWHQAVSKLDILIWNIPVPSKAKTSLGNTDWPKLYELSLPQLIMIQDGNLEQGIPHVGLVADYAVFAGVHDASFRSSQLVGRPTRRILHPHFPHRERPRRWDDRPQGWFSVQTMKGWKRVPDLLQAMQFMTNCRPRILAGGGLDHAYLTSKDKCKYFNREGKRLWDVAIEQGLDYRGWVTVGERDHILRSEVRVLIDPSWSKRYAAIGAHFNRTAVEAVAAGCVVVARSGMYESDLWTDGVNYLAMPDDGDPRQTAEVIEYACSLNARQAERFLAGGREVMRKHQPESRAQEVLDWIHAATALSTVQPLTVEQQLFRQKGERYFRKYFEGVKDESDQCSISQPRLF